MEVTSSHESLLSQTTSNNEHITLHGNCKNEEGQKKKVKLESQVASQHSHHQPLSVIEKTHTEKPAKQSHLTENAINHGNLSNDTSCSTLRPSSAKGSKKLYRRSERISKRKKFTLMKTDPFDEMGSSKSRKDGAISTEFSESNGCVDHEINFSNVSCSSLQASVSSSHEVCFAGIQNRYTDAPSSTNVDNQTKAMLDSWPAAITSSSQTSAEICSSENKCVVDSNIIPHLHLPDISSSQSAYNGVCQVNTSQTLSRQQYHGHDISQPKQLHPSSQEMELENLKFKSNTSSLLLTEPSSHAPVCSLNSITALSQLKEHCRKNSADENCLNTCSHSVSHFSALPPLPPPPPSPFTHPQTYSYQQSLSFLPPSVISSAYPSFLATSITQSGNPKEHPDSTYEEHNSRQHSGFDYRVHASESSPYLTLQQRQINATSDHGHHVLLQSSNLCHMPSNSLNSYRQSLIPTSNSNTYHHHQPQLYLQGNSSILDDNYGCSYSHQDNQHLQYCQQSARRNTFHESAQQLVPCLSSSHNQEIIEYRATASSSTATGIAESITSSKPSMPTSVPPPPLPPPQLPPPPPPLTTNTDSYVSMSSKHATYVPHVTTKSSQPRFQSTKVSGLHRNNFHSLATGGDPHVRHCGPSDVSCRPLSPALPESAPRPDEPRSKTSKRKHTTVMERQHLIHRIIEGELSPTQAAAEAGVSKTAVSNWMRRYRDGKCTIVNPPISRQQKRQRPVKYPLVEAAVLKHLSSSPASVTRSWTRVQQFAQEIARDLVDQGHKEYNGFTASAGWYQGLKRRYSLPSMSANSSASQEAIHFEDYDNSIFRSHSPLSHFPSHHIQSEISPLSQTTEFSVGSNIIQQTTPSSESQLVEREQHQEKFQQFIQQPNGDGEIESFQHGDIHPQQSQCHRVFESNREAHMQQPQIAHTGVNPLVPYLPAYRQDNQYKTYNYREQQDESAANLVISRSSNESYSKQPFILDNHPNETTSSFRENVADTKIKSKASRKYGNFPSDFNAHCNNIQSISSREGQHSKQRTHEFPCVVKTEEETNGYCDSENISNAKTDYPYFVKCQQLKQEPDRTTEETSDDHGINCLLSKHMKSKSRQGTKSDNKIQSDAYQPHHLHGHHNQDYDCKESFELRSQSYFSEQDQGDDAMDQFHSLKSNDSAQSKNVQSPSSCTMHEECTQSITSTCNKSVPLTYATEVLSALKKIGASNQWPDAKMKCISELQHWIQEPKTVPKPS